MARLFRSKKQDSAERAQRLAQKMQRAHQTNPGRRPEDRLAAQAELHAQAMAQVRAQMREQKRRLFALSQFAYRLSAKLEQYDPDSILADQARSYLTHNGLMEIVENYRPTHLN